MPPMTMPRLCGVLLVACCICGQGVASQRPLERPHAWTGATGNQSDNDLPGRLRLLRSATHQVLLAPLIKKDAAVGSKLSAVEQQLGHSATTLQRWFDGYKSSGEKEMFTLDLAKHVAKEKVTELKAKLVDALTADQDQEIADQQRIDSKTQEIASLRSQLAKLRGGGVATEKTAAMKVHVEQPQSETGPHAKGLSEKSQSAAVLNTAASGVNDHSQQSVHEASPVKKEKSVESSAHTIGHSQQSSAAASPKKPASDKPQAAVASTSQVKKAKSVESSAHTSGHSQQSSAAASPKKPASDKPQAAVASTSQVKKAKSVESSAHTIGHSQQSSAAASPEKPASDKPQAVVKKAKSVESSAHTSGHSQQSLRGVSPKKPSSEKPQAVVASTSRAVKLKSAKSSSHTTGHSQQSSHKVSRVSEVINAHKKAAVAERKAQHMHLKKRERLVSRGPRIMRHRDRERDPPRSAKVVWHRKIKKLHIGPRPKGRRSIATLKPSTPTAKTEVKKAASEKAPLQKKKEKLSPGPDRKMNRPNVTLQSQQKQAPPVPKAKTEIKKAVKGRSPPKKKEQPKILRHRGDSEHSKRKQAQVPTSEVSQKEKENQRQNDMYDPNARMKKLYKKLDDEKTEQRKKEERAPIRFDISKGLQDKVLEAQNALKSGLRALDEADRQ